MIIIKNNIKFLIGLIIFLIIGFYSGIYFNQKKIEAELLDQAKIRDSNDLSSFWKVWDTIDKKYPHAEKISNQERVYGAISGLVNSLEDPYSVFFTPEEKKMFEEEVSGNFSGIGVEVGIKDKILTVIAPLKNTPGYKAGLKSGDKILKIDKKITTDLSIEEAIKLIRGEKGTKVILTIFREENKKPEEITIIRDVINIPTLDTENRNDGIFVIKLYNFSQNSANLFRKSMEEFYNSKKDKLILDLRGNPGGYLEQAVDIASWFLPQGKTIVIEDYGDNQKKDKFRSKGYNIFNDSLKFVILIDEGSASASEILAGAMQDYNRAKLVGEKSFGKGSVQEVVNITPDTSLKITVAKWLTPNGNSISEKGLKPDYEVIYKEKDEKNKEDSQMQKAIELLNNWQL